MTDRVGNDLPDLENAVVVGANASIAIILVLRQTFPGQTGRARGGFVFTRPRRSISLLLFSCSKAFCCCGPAAAATKKCAVSPLG
jgi:hypothetical protein